MSALRWLLALVSAGLVIVVTAWEAEGLISPGPLHKSHSDLPELVGRSGCATCHGDGSKASMAAACTACHAAIGGQAASGSGLHGTIERRDDCARCHSEHTGGKLALVSQRSFRLADVPEPDRYAHDHITGFALAGAHANRACEDCHALASRPHLRPGEHRFAGLSQRCSTCHDDPHSGELGADCAACHGQSEPFPELATFVHDPAFPLDAVHAGHACAACHAASGAHSIATSRDGGGAVRACGACHDAAHRAEFVAGVAAVTARDAAATCALCHQPEHGSFFPPAEAMPAQLHRASGFALLPPHNESECAACHPNLDEQRPRGSGIDRGGNERVSVPDIGPARGLDGTPARPPARAPDDCAACHRDPHRGQFDRGTTGGRCATCHAATHFVPSRFDRHQHARTQFPLTGAHQAVGCASCHPADGAEPRFTGTPRTCAECHADVHGRRLEGVGRPQVVAGRRGCARCHDTTSFAAATLVAAEHGHWTGYALEGMHVKAACTDCHRPRQRPDARGRQFGVAPRACAACHTDPHAGQFARSGRTDCARCHSDDADSFAAVHFDHQRHGRFPLDQDHRTLKCSACHHPVETTTGTAVVRYRPLGRRCQDCHGTRRRR